MDSYMRLVMNYTTDEREEKSQKDKADTIFIGYVFLSNRTKLFFWRHLFFHAVGASPFLFPHHQLARQRYDLLAFIPHPR